MVGSVADDLEGPPALGGGRGGIAGHQRVPVEARDRQGPPDAVLPVERPLDGVRHRRRPGHGVGHDLATPVTLPQHRDRRLGAPRRLAQIGERRVIVPWRSAPADPSVPPCTVNRTGSGDGQTIGQYVRRDREPDAVARAGTRSAVSLSWTRTVVALAGHHRPRRRSCDIAMGEVEDADTTRGSMHRRARRRTAGRRRTPTAGRPPAPARRPARRGSRGAPASAGQSKVSERPSSSRWSPGNSGPLPPVPYGHHSPPTRPGQLRRRPLRGDRGDRPAMPRSKAGSPIEPRSRWRCSIRGDGHSGSATHRPGAVAIERLRRDVLGHPGPEHRLVA